MSNIKIYNEKELIKHSTLIFSGGEIQVRILNPNQVRGLSEVTILAHLRNANDILELQLLVDALRHVTPYIHIDLIMPYVPYARQDRVCYDGESYSLLVFANLINSLNFKNVTVWDFHNIKKLGLFTNIKNVESYKFINPILKNIGTNTVFVAPDKGAIGRLIEFTRYYSSTYAEKIRNPDTGVITGTKVNLDDFNKRDVFIVDDICDGGRTFTELTKVLKEKHNVGRVYLFVTHGIFSKGLTVLKDAGIDHVYTANSFLKDADNSFWSEYLTVVKG